MRVSLRIVLPAKGHVPVLQREQSLVRDGDAMSVARQIFEDLGGAAKRRFGIDHPITGLEVTKQAAPVPAVGQGSELPVKAEGTTVTGRSQVGEELPPKEPTQDPHRQQEALATWHPATAIERNPSARYHAVDVGMVVEILPPGVQHREEANVGPKVSGIPSDRTQRLGGGPKKNAVEHPLVLQGERAERVWQREDHVEVRHFEQVRGSRVQPLRARRRLALGAMAIAARVVGDGLVATGLTSLLVSPEGGGAAACQRPQNPPLFQRRAVGLLVR